MPGLRFLVVAASAAVILATSTVVRADSTTAVWADGHKSSLSDEELLRYALASPPAGYPAEAQQKKLSGSGLYELQIDKSGKTTAVNVVRSAGQAVLDQAARSALIKWRFKPAIFRSVRIPVSWSVNRVR